MLGLHQELEIAHPQMPVLVHSSFLRIFDVVM